MNGSSIGDICNFCDDEQIGLLCGLSDASR